MQATAAGYITSDTRMASWPSVQGLEFVYPRTLANGSELYKTWTEHRIAVDHVEEASDGKLHVSMRQPAWARFNATVSGPYTGRPYNTAPVWAEGAVGRTHTKRLHTHQKIHTYNKNPN